jgi:hypothetical protein
VTNQPDAKTVRLLAELLRDRSANIGERDDAAMDLAYSDDPAGLEALLEVARHADDHPMVLDSCGESIAEIAVRTGHFERSWLDGLAEPALRNVRGAFRRERPDLLDT